MKTLGVDVATKFTGWSILSENLLVGYGTIDGSKIKEVEHRLNLLYLNLYEIIKEFKPDTIAV
jgi:Holliday junction resolvasome RuvABC endonuclease subunit